MNTLEDKWCFPCIFFSSKRKKMGGNTNWLIPFCSNPNKGEVKVLNGFWCRCAYFKRKNEKVDE